MSSNCIISYGAGISDPWWGNVSYLLSASGVNGSVDIRDQKNRALKLRGAAAITNAWSLYGDGSLNVSGASNSAYLDTNLTDFDFGSGDFTVEFGVKAVSGAGSFGVILGKWISSGTPGNAWCFVHNADGTISFLWSIDGTNAASLTSSTATSYGVPRRISVSRIGSTIRMFIDGVQVASAAISGAINAGTAWFEIGAYRNGVSGTWAGQVDELRITKVTGRYSAGYPVATSPFPSQ